MNRKRPSVLASIINKRIVGAESRCCHVAWQTMVHEIQIVTILCDLCFSSLSSAIKNTHIFFMHFSRSTKTSPPSLEHVIVTHSTQTTHANVLHLPLTELGFALFIHYKVKPLTDQELTSYVKYVLSSANH